MRCVLCRTVKRLVIKLVPGVREADRDYETKVSAWRLKQCNDSAVWSNEPDGEAVRHAKDLLKTDSYSGRAELHTLAEKGSVWSMLLLGWAYHAGAGGNVDDEKADYWYRRAAHGGCQQAELRLAQLYQRRKDMTRFPNVISWGPDQPWAPSTYYIAVAKLLQPQTKIRLKEAGCLLQQCASRGDVGAQELLCSLFIHGMFGFHRRWSARRLYLTYIKNGNRLMSDKPLLPWPLEAP